MMAFALLSYRRPQPFHGPLFPDQRQQGVHVGAVLAPGKREPQR